MRKIWLPVVCIAVVAAIAIPLLYARVWQMMYGRQFTDGRISMQLNPNWVITHNLGRPSLERPWKIPTLLPSVDTLSIHQSNECLSLASIEKVKERFVKLHALFNDKNPEWFEISTRSGPASCIASEVTSTTHARDKVQDMQCILANDGTLLSLDGSDPSKQEAIEMIQSLRITRSCESHPE